jgi:hypothetical protein
MVFFEVVHALINLDLAFFVDITMNNILWVFIFVVLVNYFFKKNKLFWLLFFPVEIWVVTDFGKLTGMAFSDFNFMIINYIIKFALLIIVVNIQSLKKYTILFSILQGYSVIFLFTFLLK